MVADTSNSSGIPSFDVNEDNEDGGIIGNELNGTAGDPVDDIAERVLLVHQAHDATANDLDELAGLAEAAGGTVVGYLLSRRRTPVAGTYLGRGKVDELGERVANESISLVVFNKPLTPIQERNLEKRIECRVIDRTRLILDIFALRAKTSEGKLQVELAQLRHLSTRLVRGWTHLERQKGGIGLRGPGETQLETDRRLLGARIKSLGHRLEKVEAQRRQRRRGRVRAPVPTVSLIGYTNAGKSTLFNRMTGAGVMARDLLFATLDPTMRRYPLTHGGEVVVSDTVGFISELPHGLIKAFHSTLEEVRGSALLLHVIDASDPELLQHVDDVNEVIEEIDAGDIPLIEIYNKSDLAGLDPMVLRNADGQITRIQLSAVTGDGVDLLDLALAEFFGRNRQRRRLRLPPHAGRIRARIHEYCRILSEDFTDDGQIELELELDQAVAGWIEKQGDFKTEYWLDSDKSN
ncbi:MAG: GTPase HflX [marine bacterium B5-7]|nr:MAG: GTPase HflX [marine bacterium B5-7]